jgi:NTE family protein
METSAPIMNGLVLTGGGALAAYQVGALCALAEMLPQNSNDSKDSNPFPVLSGTSAGAINTSYLATHPNHFREATSGLKALWHSLRHQSIYRTDGFSLAGIALGWVSRTIMGGKANTKKSSNYLLDTSPLKELLEKALDFNQLAEAISNNRLRGVSITATHYFEGMSVSFFDGAPGIKEWRRSNRLGVRSPLGVEHVLASAAIPVFFPPVVIDGVAYGDGCLRQTTPLSPAIHLGAERLLSIGIRAKKKTMTPVAQLLSSQNGPMGAVKKSEATLAQIGGELMNALFLDSLESDIERMEKINQSIASFREDERVRHFGDLRPIPILSLGPSRNLSDLAPNLLKRFPLFLRYLLRGLGATSKDGGALLSYLAFEHDFVDPLMALGYEDTFDQRSVIQDFLKI